jgi:hypothetical protein
MIFFGLPNAPLSCKTLPASPPAKQKGLRGTGVALAQAGDMTAKFCQFEWLVVQLFE